MKKTAYSLPTNRLIRTLLFIGFSFVVSFSTAQAAPHNGPAASPPEYNYYTYPVPTRYNAIPSGCQNFFNNLFFRCARSANLELALEREFWGYVQNSNFSGMKNLLNRIFNYAEFSRTPYRGRLIRLIAFGNVMLSQQTRGLTLSKIPTLVTARAFGEKSNIIQPNHAFTHSITGFTDALIKFTLGLNSGGEAIVRRLLDSPREKGEYGLEAAAVGAMALTYTTDMNRILRGLSILNDCKDRMCTRTSSIAPFKVVGMYLTIAEAYVAVNNMPKATEMVNAANAFANANKMHPTMKAKLYSLGREIIGNKFASESQKLTGIGGYRQPAGPSQDAVACALCHQGAKVPNYYYSWK